MKSFLCSFCSSRKIVTWLPNCFLFISQSLHHLPFSTLFLFFFTHTASIMLHNTILFRSLMVGTIVIVSHTARPTSVFRCCACLTGPPFGQHYCSLFCEQKRDVRHRADNSPVFESNAQSCGRGFRGDACIPRYQCTRSPRFWRTLQ